ncbi:MAG: hypothetical protein CMJ58_18155 [Planctomycetaceae bacterium]|nr:hypothetical protein [Planctomycetaceae bacterium]
MTNQPAPVPPSVGDVFRAFVQYRWRWILPTLLCGSLAVAAAFVLPRKWEATQGLVVRQEAIANTDRRPGQFADLYEMRTLQETILEVAKSRQVVEATMAAVDGQAGTAMAATDEAVDEFRESLRMLPPNGAEFGKTEVFYFSVKDVRRERALALVAELCRQVSDRLQQLREERGRSLTAELQGQVERAQQLHAADTAALAEFEASIGADLGELRLLQSGNSGQSELRLQVTALQNESRKYETAARDAGELLALLRTAQDDPNQIVTVPSTLLSSQPALQRLKNGLIDAQLATARLRGTRSDDHPRVQSAAEAEERIRRDLHHELAAAIRGAEADQALAQQRLAAVSAKLAELESRLVELAELRATYANYVAATENSRGVLNQARQKLSVAQATLASAHSTNLVTTFDGPETGPHPEGPGKTTIAGAGIVGGFMLGLGILVLTTGASPYSPPSTEPLQQPVAAETHRQVEAVRPDPMVVKADPDASGLRPQRSYAAEVHADPEAPQVIQPQVHAPAVDNANDRLHPTTGGNANSANPSATGKPTTAAWDPRDRDYDADSAEGEVEARPPRATATTSPAVLPATTGVLPQSAGVMPSGRDDSGESAQTLEELVARLAEAN